MREALLSFLEGPHLSGVGRLDPLAAGFDAVRGLQGGELEKLSG